MPILTNIVNNSGDNISKERDINSQRGEMFKAFKDSFSPQISEQRNNIVDAAKSSNLFKSFQPVMEGYNKIEPYLPNIDLGEKRIGYDYETPMGPGIFSLGAEYDVDDNDYGLDFGYKWEFDNGGIATLTEDLEQRMTTPDPQVTKPKKLTDEMKDYLYDYLLDFMFKQRQREQQENEGRIPPFNYFDMEV
jgi:hypothetical protein